MVARTAWPLADPSSRSDLEQSLLATGEWANGRDLQVLLQAWPSESGPRRSPGPRPWDMPAERPIIGRPPKCSSKC
ncbi:hypothetical protein J7T55_014701 [Diaporthe amygdali]|uniref:uncharacterized protein n=1 Tax=Phomopsis amygdali TaxID=1214568 RepID=UPI0022FE5F67|nr:uncharacterized protein J7T55_014701 [Diaporthe amygdali]KAJ0107171.1 hypothetical protein J7T55_014701 [Diaporthe amygdali]